MQSTGYLNKNVVKIYNITPNYSPDVYLSPHHRGIGGLQISLSQTHLLQNGRT